MKYPASLYARAFTDVLASTHDGEHKSVVRKFAEILAKNGDLEHSEKILKEVMKILVKKEGGRFVEIEIARKNFAVEDKLISAFSKKDYVEISVKKELLAGSRILINSEKELDFSFQKKLRQLFS